MLRFRTILSLLAVVGLILAPLGRPAMAVSPSAMQEMAMASAAMAAANMPCCPDDQPATNCAKDCPLMALCFATTVSNAPAVPTTAVIFTPASAFQPVDDRSGDGLLVAPSPRPPKT